jgi:hypothetical protein
MQCSYAQPVEEDNALSARLGAVNARSHILYQPYHSGWYYQYVQQHSGLVMMQSGRAPTLQADYHEPERSSTCDIRVARSVARAMYADLIMHCQKQIVAAM